MTQSIFEPSDLPTLKEPDPFTHYVLESPILPSIALLLLGIVLMLALRSRAQTRAALGALGAGLVLGAGLFSAGSLVTTDRETLIETNTTLIHAAATGDAPALRELLHEDVRVRARFANVQGREDIIALSTNRAARIIESHTVRETQAQVMGPRVARTLVKVRIQGSTAPNISWWMLDWERSAPGADDWRATRIEPVWIQGYDNPAG